MKKSTIVIIVIAVVIIAAIVYLKKRTKKSGKAGVELVFIADALKRSTEISETEKIEFLMEVGGLSKDQAINLLKEV